MIDRSSNVKVLALAEASDPVVVGYFARVYTDKKYCDCPGAEIGKIGIPSSHLQSCKHSKAKTTDIAVIKQDEYFGGYRLGVAP